MMFSETDLGGNFRNGSILMISQTLTFNSF